MSYTGDRSDPVPFSEVLQQDFCCSAGHSFLRGWWQKLGLLFLLLPFLSVLRDESVTAAATWWPLLLWPLCWDMSRVTCTERHSAGKEKCINLMGSYQPSQFLAEAYVCHRVCIISKCHSPLWLLARKTSPTMYNQNTSKANGLKSIQTAELCEVGKGCSLGHGGRFCTVKKCAGDKLPEWDGVVLVKGVRAEALHGGLVRGHSAAAVSCLGGKLGEKNKCA